MSSLKSGQKIVWRHTHYRVHEVGDDVVRLKHRGRIVTETKNRVRTEIADRNAVIHRECENCGLPVDPDNGKTDTLHYGCWFADAQVSERCETESERISGVLIASQAARASDPTKFLLGVLSDPARPLWERNDAEFLLSGAVPTKKITSHRVACPKCGNEEQFRIDPETGDLSCHCGESLERPGDVK